MQNFTNSQQLCVKSWGYYIWTPFSVNATKQIATIENQMIFTLKIIVIKFKLSYIPINKVFYNVDVNSAVTEGESLQ